MKKKAPAKNKKGLGKGLGAILKDNNLDKDIAKQQAEKSNATKSITLEIPVKNIITNPWQPRQDFDNGGLKELSQSIEKHGIIQPITLRKLNDRKYQLISGERRLQATKLAGIKKITAYIRTANDQQMLEMALIENIQREDLNPIEIAIHLQRLMSECNLTQENLGEQIGKKRATITNYLRLLKLPDIVQSAIIKKQISMGHAKAILSLENIDMQIDCLKEVLSRQLSVRQTEQLTKTYTESKMNPLLSNKKGEEHSSQTKAVLSDLSSHFDTKISLKINSKNRGELKIPFSSMDDLNRIIDIIKS